MGCGGSKIDDQPLVILCRKRKEMIKAASHHRCALAAAHLAYFQSLCDVGEAIRRFVDEELVVGSSSSPGSSVLTLPSDEGKPRKHKITPSSTSISHSIIEEGEEELDEDTEDSHLHLSSGSESESESEAGSDTPEGHSHIHIESSPEPKKKRSPETFPSGYPPDYPPGYPPGYAPGYPPGYSSMYPYPVGGWGFNGGNPNTNSGMYFMKKSAPSSRPVIFQPETHQVENAQWQSDPGSGFSGYSPGNPSAGFFGYPSPSGNYSQANRRSPSPVPPSPPKVSSWDFLNVFDTYDYTSGRSRSSNYYLSGNAGLASISSSPDSKEVREREGIPELEEVTEEVIKQPYRRPKRTNLEKVNEHMQEDAIPDRHEIGTRNVNRRGYVGERTSMAVPLPESATESSFSSKTMSSFSYSDEESDIHHVSSGEGKSSTYSNGHETVMTRSSREVEDEYRTKKEVSFEFEETTTPSFDVESSKISSLSTLSGQATRDLREAVKDIKNEFEVASSCGKEVAMLLEVSKLPYQHKNNGFKVIFSRIMYLVAPSTRSPPQLSIRLTSRTMKMAKSYSEHDVNGGFTGNLSSTLEKLYVWEKKLYKEVKDEEKLRAIYEEKCKTLKKMDSYGAESTKIDATRASIKKLLTKIDICIRSVDSISRRIHKLRDEELQPQLTQLIHGLIRMWRSMLKCHQKQFKAIMESKVRSLRANTSFQESGLKAVLDLEMELREWCISFNDWINSQKSYVESLNGWLYSFLDHKPESTDDGIAPFSPGRIEAPAIFVICHDWQEAMAKISGENVTNAMQGFASSLVELWERQDEEQQQRVKAEYVSHDFEKRMKNLRKVKEEEEERSVVSKGVSALDDLKVDLDSMRKKLAEERGRHKETIKLVNNAASNSLKAGLLPIFEALRNFSAQVVKAHEIVRLHYPTTVS